ncbi:MAG: hypothetical protein RR655_07670, partial [Raoultibacter sp.]
GAITLTFDTPAKLPKNTFSAADKFFVGWSTPALGHLYSDEDSVVNLCTLDAAGTPTGKTLTAQWATVGAVCLVITSDDTPVILPKKGKDIHLVQEGIATDFVSFDMATDGIYLTPVVPPVPLGSYTVRIDGWPTTKVQVKVVSGEATIVYLDYFTIEAMGDEAIPHIIDPITHKPAPKVDKVPLGAGLGIGAVPSAAEGFHFESWTASGAPPLWENND